MLLSCGHKKQNSSQELSTLSTSEKGLKNFSQAQFEIQLIPPMQPGRAWKRKIQLTNHPFGQKSLRVEKKRFCIKRMDSSTVHKSTRSFYR
jgi:hypothetical protein